MCFWKKKKKKEAEDNIVYVPRSYSIFYIDKGPLNDYFLTKIYSGFYDNAATSEYEIADAIRLLADKERKGCCGYVAMLSSDNGTTRCFSIYDLNLKAVLNFYWLLEEKGGEYNVVVHF